MSAKAQVGSEINEDRIVAFYSLSHCVTSNDKGQPSSLLIGRPHFFLL